MTRKLTLNIDVAICENPNCFSCQTRVLRAVAEAQVAEFRPEFDSISDTEAAALNLLMAAALKFTEVTGKKDLGAAFEKAAKAAFRSGQRQQITVASAQAQQSTRH